jgi:SAM-dependent methyltransferase
MVVIELVVSVIFICFAIVILFGAPYLPTLKPQVRAALELANLKPGETLLELGCGDGRVLIAAAQVGVHSIGYELNPILVALTWLRTRRYRKQITVRWRNIWNVDLPPADAIFVFLLPRYMVKLDNKIIQSKHRPVKLISFAFKIPDKIVSSEQAGVMLYEY